MRRARPGASASACGARARDLDERRVPLLGVTAAFVFAAQMLNFPVAGGTSGHFLGAALAAILLGPWLACLVMAVVLGVQAFVFADGGITALGANMLNMGVIGALLVGGLMHRRAPRAAARRGALLPSPAVGAWLAVMAGATADRAGARDLRHRPARHRAAGDARHPRADRRRRGGRSPSPRSAPCWPRRPGPRPRPGVAGVRMNARLHDHRPRAGDRARHRRLAVRLERARRAQPASPRITAFATRARTHDAPVPGYAFPGVHNEKLAKGLAGFTGTLPCSRSASASSTVARGARRSHERPALQIRASPETRRARSTASIRGRS